MNLFIKNKNFLQSLLKGPMNIRKYLYDYLSFFSVFKSLLFKMFLFFILLYKS